MNEFRTMMENNYNTVSQSIAGVNSYLEYLERLKLRALDFLSDEGDEDTFTLLLPRNGKQTIHFLSRADYNWAQDHYEDATLKRAVKLNEGSDTNDLSAEDIIDGFNDTIENMSLQIEYLNMMIDDEEEVKKVTFIEKITNIYPEIAKEKINQFADFIENSDVITSIKNFFAETADWVVSKVTDASTDEIIEVLPTSEYVSVIPVWYGGIVQFVEQVTGFFAGVFKFTVDIAHFFRELGRAFINLLTWVICKVNRNLSTNYEFTKRSNGILDVPLLQAKICTLDSNLEPIDGPANFTGGYNTNIARAISCEKYTTLWAHSTPEGATYDNDWKTLLSGMFKKTWNGQILRNVTEVILPCPMGIGWNNDYVPISFSIRVGPGADNYGYLQLIPIIQVSTVKDLPDHIIAASINYSFNRIAHQFRNYFNVMGFHYNDVPGAGTFLWTDNNYTLLNPASIDVTNTGPYDLIGNAWFFLPSRMTNNDDLGCQFRALVMGFLLPYFVLNSNAAENISKFSSYTTVGRLNYLLGMGTELTHSVQQSIAYYAAEDKEDFNYLIPLYKPYSVYKKMPVSAHYQTVTERITEVSNTIWAIIIIAAAAYLTVRYVKFRKDRKFLAKYLDASVEARLWENTVHPGTYNVAEIFKDWKKASRVRLTNSLLGIGSTSAIAGGLGSFIGATMSLAGTEVENVISTSENIKENIVKVGQTIDPNFEEVNS